MMNLQLKVPIATNLVIEEPEQNLFPKTQVSLIYYIFSKLQHQTRGDSIVVTTHSPYILYALNNCMLAALAIKRDKENEELISEFSTVPPEARIDPGRVSVWEIEDGCIKDNTTIQDEQGLIRDNYFDRIMKTVMADFNNLINFIR
ncbi:MAG: ATP-binding protein, partial [Muribaculaceae bacterium]|nr:ATP-binding protein [Muribaculaceae bacterium]